ncbi:hypothetical protein DERP_011647 [Dermatophagoides pteronyssinus]|uniref:FAST kinase domain-containing protein 1, mitochondrial-like n=1 Tax=Dermatophagoides pteronyssinus TaxID=6956 RepID=A0ABQ8JX20_DERPT|nr:hypothetical protein DERP_011647 [Dermatophagoides pteronyssinus]
MYRQIFFQSINRSTRQGYYLSKILCRNFGDNQMMVEQKSSTKQLQMKIENRLKNRIVEIDLGRGPVRSNDLIDQIDVLEESIVKATNIDQIRELIRYNYRQFDTNHVVQLFESIDNIVRYSTDSDSTRYDLLGSKEFGILANRTMKIIRNFEASDSLNTMIILNNLGISNDTVLQQAMMQMIRSWINDYSIDDLYHLVRFMKKQQLDNQNDNCRHSLLQAIQLALPYALKHRIQYKELDFFHARTLMKTVEMIAYFGIDIFGDLNLVEKCLHYLHQQLNHLGPQEWLNILAFIYEMNIRIDEPSSMIAQTIRLIIRDCIDNIRNTDSAILDDLQPRFFVNVMMKIDRSASIYYNRYLFDLIAEHASNHTEKFGLINLYLITRKLGQFRYINHRMLKFFAKQIDNENPDLMGKDSSTISLVNLFHLFSKSSNYHEEIHENFTKLAEKIIQSERFIMETTKFKMNYFYFLQSCLLLNARISENILIEWFGSEYFNKALDVLQSQSKRIIFLKTMAIIYEGLFVQKLIELNEKNADYIRRKLQPFLNEYIELIRNGLECQPRSFEKEQIRLILSKQFEQQQQQQQIPVDQIIRINQVTPTGSIIDVEICLEKQKIAIILLNRRNYCRHPSIIDGETKFRIESLQQQNYQSIIIDMEMFQRLTEYERELFLQKEIKNFL